MEGEHEIGWIRSHLAKARKTLMQRGKFDGDAFEIMWSVDNDIETALNWLIDLERTLGIRNLS